MLCYVLLRHTCTRIVVLFYAHYTAKNSRLPVHHEFRYLLCFYWKSSLALPRIDHLERWTTDHLASPRITHYTWCVSTEEKCEVLPASPRITSHHRAPPRITSNFYRSVRTDSWVKRVCSGWYRYTGLPNKVVTEHLYIRILESCVNNGSIMWIIVDARKITTNYENWEHNFDSFIELYLWDSVFQRLKSWGVSDGRATLASLSLSLVLHKAGPGADPGHCDQLRAQGHLWHLREAWEQGGGLQHQVRTALRPPHGVWGLNMSTGW